jgi:hypothetical protein
MENNDDWLYRVPTSVERENYELIIERISDCGNPYSVFYKDLEMVTTLD